MGEIEKQKGLMMNSINNVTYILSMSGITRSTYAPMIDIITAHYHTYKKAFTSIGSEEIMQMDNQMCDVTRELEYCNIGGAL